MRCAMLWLSSSLNPRHTLPKGLQIEWHNVGRWIYYMLNTTLDTSLNVFKTQVEILKSKYIGPNSRRFIQSTDYLNLLSKISSK